MIAVETERSTLTNFQELPTIKENAFDRNQGCLATRRGFRRISAELDARPHSGPAASSAEIEFQVLAPLPHNHPLPPYILKII